MDRPIITTVQQLAAAVQAIESAVEEGGPVRVRSLQEHARSLGRSRSRSGTGRAG
jgi:carbamoyl-phosphate synthase large subunit